MQAAYELRSVGHSVFPDLEPVAPATPRIAKAPPPRVARGAEKTRAASRLDGYLKATTISYRNLSQYGDLLVATMEARKKVFVDRLKWDVPHTDGMEFDQYDTPEARWVAIHEFGEVLAGIRLAPTTAQCGIYSYMLRDAQKGMLDSIPTDVLFFEAPVDPNIFEASRLFISDEVPAERRLHVQSLLVTQMAASARAMGATHVIGIVPSLFSRWLRRLDLDAVAVGPRFEIDGTRSQAALFNVMRLGN